jgi:D-3-phosphoglycerate dehydrogenase
MSTKYIYVTEPEDLDPIAIKETLAGTDWQPIAGDVAFTDSQAHPYEALLIRSNTKIDASITDYFPGVQHIVRAGVGLDNVDLDFCDKQSTKVYNAPGANADAVSDYTVGMMLFALRKLYKKHAEDVSSWNRFKFTGQNMANQTVGIVGFGNIGRLLHKKLRGFNCKQFLIYDPFLPKDLELEANMRVATFEEILRESTIISLHLPLTEQTKYLIGKHNLALIQENAIIINASRGGIVEETAVVAMLQSKDFVYIADAVEDEPEVNKDLLTHENIIITPHIGSLTDESEREMVRVALRNLLAGKTAVIF